MLKRDNIYLRTSSYVILSILTGFALFLRWSYATSTSPFIDEFKTLWNAQNIVTGLASPFAWGPGADAPLFRNFEALILQLFGFNTTVARTPSIIISVATIPLIFYVGKRMFSVPAGLLACALMTFAPELVVWGARARPYPLFLLLTLLTVLLFYRWMTEPDDGGQISRVRGWLFVVCFVVALFTHLGAILLLPGFALGALIRHGPGVFTRKWVFLDFLVCGVGVLVVLALFLQSETIPGAIPLSQTVWAGFGQIDLGVKNLEVFSKFLRRTPGGFALFLLAVGGLAYLIVWRIRSRLRVGEPSPEESARPEERPAGTSRVAVDGQNDGLVLLYVLSLSAAGVIILLFGPGWGGETRYILFLFPMLSLIVGTTAVRLLTFLLRRAKIGGETTRQWVVLGFTVVGIGLIGVSSLPGGAGYRQEWGYDLAFIYVGDQWRKGDVMVTVAPVACLVSLGRCDYFAIQKAYETYAIERNGRLVEALTGLPLIMIVQEMEEVLDGHERVWFVTDEGRFITRYDSDFVQLIWDRMELVSNERGALVFRSLHQEQPLIRRETDISFEDKFRLRGCDLRQRTFAPGEKLELTLYWQGVEYANYFGVDYSVFVHLVDQAGRLWAQADGYPVGGMYPTSHWRSTDVVIPDRREIRLPVEMPSGRYRLDVGMYTLSDLQRLSVWDEEGIAVGDRVALDYVEIPEGEEERLMPTHSVEVNLGDEVALLGYDLASRTVSPGGTVDLTLYWQARVDTDEDYTVFVHLVGEDGLIWGQQDGQPQGGFYPTSFWVQGEVVVDEHGIPVEREAPIGEYELRVGMYLLQTMQRLPIVEGAEESTQGWVNLGGVQVSEG